jgi:hypothetical protein
MLRQTLQAACAAALLAAPALSIAQSEGKGFLFKPPRAAVSFRLGYAGANAGSDVFSFTTDQLTIDKGDFSSLGFETDVSIRLAGSTHAVLSLGISGMDKRSEFRDFVDNEELPIEQNTSFVRVPLTVGIKQYFTPPGHSIGRFAWVPTKVAPYAGIAGGAMWYRFHQDGDFIDFETMDVFSSQFLSDGWTGVGQVMGGADVSLSARLALTGEARYRWAKATLSRDFVDFERLDLAGFSTTVGLTVRF